MDVVRLRYLGETRVRVPKLQRVVEPDELVGVPRDVYERYAWPEGQWRREDEDPKLPAAGDGEQGSAAAATSRRKAGRDA